MIFRCGTVVYLAKEEKEIFTGFDISYEEEFPHHRTAEFKSILEENEHDWKWSQTLKYKDDISRAYHKLIKDGYPYPGGAGADRNVLPVGKDTSTMMTIFPHRTIGIITLTNIGKDLEEYTNKQLIYTHQSLGAEHRRYDFYYATSFCTYFY